MGYSDNPNQYTGTSNNWGERWEELVDGCPTVNGNIYPPNIKVNGKAFISQELEKAKEEARLALIKDFETTSGGLWGMAVKEERNRLLGIIEEQIIRSDLILAVSEYHSGWNQALESLKGKINE